MKFSSITKKEELSREGFLTKIDTQFKINKDVIRVHGESGTWDGLVSVDILNAEKKWTTLYKIDGGCDYANRSETQNEIVKYLSNFYDCPFSKDIVSELF